MARRTKNSDPKIDFISLPTRPMVEVRISDIAATMRGVEKWARSQEVRGAIVRVEVEIGPADSLDANQVRAALMKAGAWSVLPIVPTRSATTPSAKRAGGWDERKPVSEAFADYLKQIRMPKGVTLAEVEMEFARLVDRTLKV